MQNLSDLSWKRSVAAFLGCKARNLLMIWPDRSDWAAQTLGKFKAQTVLYGGESYGGCTADDGFFFLLEEHFEQTEVVALPQFEGIHDDLYISSKRSSASVCIR